MAGLFSTPATVPNRCPICGGEVFLEFAEPPGVALCPGCGLLFRRVCARLGVSGRQVNLSTLLLEAPGADSLDLVEMVMELEEEFGVRISEEQAGKITTIGEVVAVIESLAGHDR